MKIKAQDFVDRPKHKLTDKINNLPEQDYKTFKNLDDPKYDWIQVGNTKYGRSMYCRNTNIKRSQTMGEFYGGGIVD